MSRVDYTKLHKACKTGNLNDVKFFLSQTAYKSEINTLNGLCGYSPLHEAVLARRPEIIKELLRFDANINIKAHDGHTPLHIAASRNYCECISVLLSHGANINQLDSFGRTPCRIAEIYFCNNASRLLRSEEIYSILRHPLSKTQVSNYLKDIKLNNVEDNFFQKCLDIIVENDNYAAVQVVLSLKHQNIKECLEKAFRRPQCSKTLLMVFLFYVVLKKLNGVLKFLIDPGTIDLKKKFGSLDIEVSVEKLIEMRLFIEEIKGDLNFYVSLACSENVKNYEAVKVLLKNHYYNKDLQVASWSKLNLSCLKAEWFQEITVLNLNLHDNALKIFPSSISNYLNIVKVLDLSKNNLKAIPPELLMLPKLQTLLLSSNQLQQLPDVKKWSPDLEKLSLNDNNLKSFPENVDGLFVKHINIADNQLKFIPESICTLKHLVALDISRNSDIHQIPAAIGKMETLDDLIINGLTIKDPPLDYLNNVSTSHIKNFLIARSRSSVPYYIMKLMIIGFSKQGKTTLLHRLQNKTKYDEDISTTGINIQKITITRPSKPTYNFRAWDFAGQEEYYITHQCFMSGSSLYLLLWDINEKLNGVKMLKVWLESLFARSIHFSLIIVATKVDLLRDDLKSVKDEMKSEIYNLFESTPAYKKNHNLMDKFALMFLSLNPKYESYAKDMSDLKSKIYEVASKMKCENSDENFMGRLVPESYMKLDSEIEKKRKFYKENDIPILNREDILEIAKSLSCKGDEFTERDIDTAALFLHTTGTILYYNTTYGGLKNMYFICPSSVCKLMSKLITEDRVHNFITNGILQKSIIPLILENSLCGETSVIVNAYLRLLSIFQIAIEIDDHRVFVPSKLPSDAPLYSVNESGPLLKRYHLFPWIPFGFWPRFTSRFLALIKEVLLPHTLEYFEDSVELGYFFDKNVIKCWRKGLIFDHPNVFFSIQEIESKKEGMDTIETCVQHSPVGYRVLSYIVDQIRTVILEWFQGVLYFADNMQIESYFECPTCTSLGIKPPVLFNINYAFQRIYQTIEEKSFSIPCEYNHSPRVINLDNCCPDLTFRDLTDDLKLCGNDVIYAKTDKVAGGQCGDVYRGNFKNEIVAIKCYKFAMANEVLPSLEKFYEFRQEVLMINKLYHPCIIKFKGVSFKPELCVMLEYAEHGSLATVIYGANSVVILRLVRLRICQQIASALLFMHKHNIVHRDIKSDNILVFSLSLYAKVNIKLTDFNTACFMSCCGLKSVTGTKGYTAPEMISSKSYLDNYTFSIDVYSFSIVMYELITYRRPFHQVQHSNEINIYVRKGFRPMFYDVYYAFYGLINLTKLMTMMWHQEASERPNTKDVINQLRSPAFQLIFGMEKLQGCSPRELCYIHTTDELWVSCDKSSGKI